MCSMKTETGLVVGKGDSVHPALSAGQYGLIARRAVLPRQHVGRILKGTRGTKLLVAARIANAAGVSLDRLYRFIMAQPTNTIAFKEMPGDGRRVLKSLARRKRKRKPIPKRVLRIPKALL